MLQPGQVIDERYEVVRSVGRGAMATVYEVRHTGLRSRHALKVLDAELAEDASLRDRFLAEGQIQAQLRHPNIVEVTDIVTDPVPGLVMELMDGAALDEFLRNHGAPRDAAGVLALFQPILAAVGAAHAARIVHRDLKPENILVGTTPDGTRQVKVTDFGIAKVMEGAALFTGKKKTEVGVRLGTVLYMSPEQIRGSADLGPRSDIFSLGAVLYEIATGRMAFEAPSEYDSMSRIVAGIYEAPERVVANLHPGLAACIRRALDPDPARRYPTCTAFREALAQVQWGNSQGPPPPSRHARLEYPAPAPPPPAPGPASPPHHPEGGPTGLAIASLILGVLGLLAWCIPLFGFPVTLTGLVLGALAMRTPGQTLAIVGVALSFLGLLASLINCIVGIAVNVLPALA